MRGGISSLEKVFCAIRDVYSGVQSRYVNKVIEWKAPIMLATCEERSGHKWTHNLVLQWRIDEIYTKCWNIIVTPATNFCIQNGEIRLF